MLQELKEIKIEDYHYDLPGERVARFPLERREDARLLAYAGGEIRDLYFRDAPSLARAGDLLVFNDTRVVHARLPFRKPTGAAIEVFCLEPALPGDHALNFAAREACEWYCLVGNAKRWKGGEIRATGDGLTLRATRIGTRGEEMRVRFEWDAPLSFGEVLERLGRVPIPPYLNREATGIDETRYQTVYSRHEGSVAAPTAGLHFSEELLRQVRATGATLAEVTLHVGAGTFKPVKAGQIGEHEMHTERVLFSRQLVDQLARAPREVIAVGTTSARSLESLYWMGVKRLHGLPAFNTLGQWEAYTLPGGHPAREAWGALARWFDEEGASRLEARSTLMIVPGYKFRVVTGLFTNFHQPRSTLLLLVAAAIGEEWRRVYDHALTRGYRFLSYGDGSFLEVAKDNRV